MKILIKYNFLIFLCFVNTKTIWAQHRVVIDTIDDMARYGDQGVCIPYDSFYDITCKDYPPSVSNRGFWSSCTQGNCELKINIGSLGGLPAKPVKLEVLSFVQGSNSEIRARHQLVPGGTIANINPLIESAPGWVNNELNLNPNLAWTEDSVILIRLSSSPFNDQIDIVDKIVVEFLGDSPSTIEPSTIEPDVSTIEPEPSTIEPSTLEPSTIEPSTIEPEPSTVEPEPSTIEPEPSTIEPGPSTIQPSTIEPDEPSTIEPSTIDPVEPSTIEPEPSTIRPIEPSTIEPEPSTLPDDPTTEPTTPSSTDLTTAAPICPPDIYCRATGRYNDTWEVCAGKTGIQFCPNNSTGIATWICQSNGKFLGDWPDYTNCAVDWISDIEKKIEQAQGQPILIENATEYMDTIGKNVENRTYFPHEIGTVVQLCRRVVALVSEDAEFLPYEALMEDTWGVFGGILSKGDQWNFLSNEDRMKTGTEFITELEQISLELSFRIPNATIYRKEFKKFSEFSVLSGVQLKGNSPLSYPENHDESYIQLPSDWAKYLDEERVKFLGLAIGSAQANRIFSGNLNLGNSSSQKIINSKIMGFSFGTMDENLLDFQLSFDEGLMVENQSITLPKINFEGKGVQITFRHDLLAWGDKAQNIRRKLHDGEKAKVASGTASCVYWDMEKLNWSTSGCKRVSTDREETICECDHLTSFAVLMDVHNYVGKDKGLEILTLVLCPISIICIAICLIISFNVPIDRSPRNALTANLCACLLIGNLLIVFVMDKHYFFLSDGLCVASAVVIHYIFLCAFMWMAMEAFLICRMLWLDIFQQGKDYMFFQHVVAYGVPAIIVGATALIDGLSDEIGYGNDTYCWLNESYIWAFMGPVAVILIANFLLLGFSLIKAYKFANRPKANARQKSQWIITCLSMTGILGLTWIFGFLMAIDNSSLANISAYIFTVLNASQGILLLIFHGILNPKFLAILERKWPKLFRKSPSPGTSHHRLNTNSSFKNA